MFVHYVTEVPVSMPAVERGLDSFGTELGALADLAYREAEIDESLNAVLKAANA